MNGIRTALIRNTAARRVGIRGVLVRGAVLTALALAATFALDPYRNFQLATIAATFCATAGLTVLVGWTGQLSLGHAALMAAGGYGYALTARALTEVGVGGAPRFLLSLLAAVLLAAAVGWLLGLAAARLRGPYLAGVTLAVVIALPAVATVFSPVLRGDQGLQIRPDPVPSALASIMVLEQWQAWVAILVTGIVVTSLVAVCRGRWGLWMRAVRDDETAARISGIRSGRVKVGAFALSAVTAGVGGALLCFVTQSVSPGAYTLAFSLLLVVAVVVGGLGSVGGAAIGAALIVLVPWVLGTLTASLPAEAAQRLSGNLPVLVFGALLTVMILVRPGGLASLRPRRRRAPGSAAPASDIPAATVAERSASASVAPAPAASAHRAADEAAVPASLPTRTPDRKR
ncbi:branched-chain amino acid ABC transporter permease [Microbacterium telephonicum]|uniref:Amino acid/amide ABC transporter membrane protein 2 (HAAT family) n=1 Tax=Microbacterium telephonicum TaxID=1714841 RepID=A0A498CBJ6_9MICO|nr:branched-chain amino acid ABC transporter permease [Microbacterium telephonicum]RLK52587.1 amino acid/amide ABC transporter membrane protein 2 (HAAT family) [Microbacterium telephonicum]